MDLKQLSLDAIRDRLVQNARIAGMTVEEHAAAEFHKLEATYGKIVVIGFPCAFMLGFILGRVL